MPRSYDLAGCVGSFRGIRFSTMAFCATICLISSSDSLADSWLSMRSTVVDRLLYNGQTLETSMMAMR